MGKIKSSKQLLKFAIKNAYRKTLLKTRKLKKLEDVNSNKEAIEDVTTNQNVQNEHDQIKKVEIDGNKVKENEESNLQCDEKEVRVDQMVEINKSDIEEERKSDQQIEEKMNKVKDELCLTGHTVHTQSCTPADRSPRGQPPATRLFAPAAPSRAHFLRMVAISNSSPPAGAAGVPSHETALHRSPGSRLYR